MSIKHRLSIFERRDKPVVKSEANCPPRHPSRQIPATRKRIATTQEESDMRIQPARMNVQPTTFFFFRSHFVITKDNQRHIFAKNLLFSPFA
ncbi:MAG: hypothetical protein BGO01_17310 [Armatimonadetes bacterium 55-13]|nr:MAG: hypothetical protein BGO01_17310 [Armatimonadetes bacterium 55-13]